MTAVSTKVPLPNSTCGASMRAQGFGTWQAPPGEVYAAVKAAIAAGYRLIDCAKVYGNQDEVGRAIAESIAEGIVTREDLYIVSKVWNYDHSPPHVLSSTAATVAALQCGYLDCLLMHWPVAWAHPQVEHTRREDMFLKNSDGGAPVVDIPLTETYAAMEECVAKGLAKDIGLSNFSEAQVKEILAAVKTVRPAALQIEVHPSLPQKGLRALCASEGIAVMAYCPLGIGYSDPSNPTLTGVVHDEELQAIALKEHARRVGGSAADAVSPSGMAAAADMLLRWSSQVGCVCLSKSANPSRIAANAQTPFGGLSEEAMAELEAYGVRKPRRIVNPTAFRLKPEPFFQ